MKLGLNDGQIEVVMGHLDKDSDGSISIHEFMGISLKISAFSIAEACRIFIPGWCDFSTGSSEIAAVDRDHLGQQAQNGHEAAASEGVLSRRRRFTQAI